MSTATALRRAVLITVAASLAMALAIVLAPIARAATPAELEVCFLDRINAARVASGTPAMVMSSSLSVYGRTHSTAMANDGNLFHSGPSQLDPVLPAGWQAWGENVGYATGSEDCSWLFEGFWESPNHKANLLNPIFDTAGIGVIVDGTDTMWTTHVFVQTASPTTTTLPPTTTSTTNSSTTTPATTTTTHAVATTSTSTTSTTASPASSTTTVAGEATTSSTTTPATTIDEVADTPAGEAIADGGVATEASSPIVGETVAAGIDPACPDGCPQTKIYAMFLMAVAVVGGAISWWAFRS